MALSEGGRLWGLEDGRRWNLRGGRLWGLEGGRRRSLGGGRRRNLGGGRFWGFLVLSLASCGGCREEKSGGPPASTSSGLGLVADVLPRCRGEAQRIAIPGEGVIVGDVAIGPGGLLVGVIRGDGGKRLASVMRTGIDLTTSHVFDVGVSFGDDPPPSPRWSGKNAFVSYYSRRSTDAGPRLRELRVVRLEEGGPGKVEATIVQQADESTAFDVAWNEAGSGLAAWDEDAPAKLDASTPPLVETYAPEGRGFVKVQVLGQDTRRVASPESSDAEAPRLLARPGGGFWLAWLARRAEEAGYAIESPGDKRVYRWVEVVPLAASGEPAGPVRRVSSDKGRASSFDLARSGSDLVVILQDDAASSDGAGARVVRYVVGDTIDARDVVDGGVGHALAELVAASSPSDEPRWLAWTDTSERAHVAPLGSGFLAISGPTSEPSLDGARVVAAASPDVLYALVGASPSDGPSSQNVRPELRRFVCPHRR